MKFQNPSFKFFLNGRMDEQTDKPNPLFQSWGHKNNAVDQLATGQHLCYSLHNNYSFYF